MGTRVIIYGAAAEAMAEKAVEELVGKMLDAGVEAAKRYAPVDTGALRDSIHAEQDGKVGTYGSELEYAPYVEMGTRKMGAQPYLRPSVDAIKQAFG